ncbi:hypothetical protein [Mucilaginibacter terrae]|uniref:TonB-dependent receptor plug domain-containing protein n=1 Tax=Mucilaginibacter terrae TaxID=1955052 RepID=A0ABU3GN02_9SPHI|nr:hypothetical protein [Mucilaginibacter terrae]MDT3401159.1 hypothetical protein [Mucilaginibacter terrae]
MKFANIYQSISPATLFRWHAALVGITFFLELNNAVAQSSGSTPPGIFEEWVKKRPREKVYINTDRNVYFKGDTIWFNAYIVSGTGNQLSSLSGALYVELLVNSGKISELKIPVFNGLAKGCIATDHTIADGDYSIRAYTRLMRNDPASFFQKNVYIGDSKVTHIRSSILSSSHMQNGAHSVDLKYTDTNGEPIVTKSFKYDIIVGPDTLKSGTSSTDGNGSLSLNFKSSSHLPYANIKVELNNESLNTVVAIDRNSALDLQILPEGGTLVEGIQSRMAVKCLGPDGYGRNVIGEIVDNLGVKVADFDTKHYGMGQFFFVPEKDKTYTAIVGDKSALSTKVNLPAAAPDGVTFSAYTNIPDTITVRIQSSPSIFSSKYVWHLVGIAGNELVLKKDFTLAGSLLSFKIPGNGLPPGVLQLTLFSDKYEPIAERLVFNYPIIKASLTISNLKDVFLPRQKININLHSEADAHPVVGSYSVSVTNEKFLGVAEDDEHTLQGSLLLCSDVKGNVEHPNYYFHNVDDKKKAQLDLLLRTQGYRSFNWKDLKDEKKPSFSPEGLGTVFSGSAKTLFGKPYPGADITILSIKAKLFQQTKTDTLGRFSFPPFILADSVKITFKASAPDKKRRLAIEIDSIPGFHPLINESYNYMFNNTYQTHQLADIFNFKNEQQKYGGGIKRIDLKEVVVKSKQNRLRSNNYNGAGRADQVILGAQLKPCANLSICLAGILNGVVFKTVDTDLGVVVAPFLTRGGPHSRPMQLYWNGLQIDLHDYPTYLEQNIENPQDIESIEILKNDNYTSIYGAQNRGVIVVTTRGNNLSGNKLNLSTRLFQPTGFSKVRDFYVPKYDISSKIQKPDFRPTVYWNPSVITSSKGDVPIEFYNTDDSGMFRMTIEGITPDGIMSRNVYRYKVQQ